MCIKKEVKRMFLIERKKSMNPVVAGMTGLLIGAVGTAVGFSMADENKRKKVATKAIDLAKRGNHTMNGIKKSAREALDEIREDSDDSKSKSVKRM